MVDWELCTLGDPLADVGLLMVYWPSAGEDGRPRPARQPGAGLPHPRGAAARYAERSGRDLSQLDFFVALGYWKLAIILEGVYARYAAGGYGKVDEGIEAFASLVERLAEAADEAERADELLRPCSMDRDFGALSLRQPVRALTRFSGFAWGSVRLPPAPGRLPGRAGGSSGRTLRSWSPGRRSSGAPRPRLIRRTGGR